MTSAKKQKIRLNDDNDTEWKSSFLLKMVC